MSRPPSISSLDLKVLTVFNSRHLPDLKVQFANSTIFADSGLLQRYVENVVLFVGAILFEGDAEVGSPVVSRGVYLKYAEQLGREADVTGSFPPELVTQIVERLEDFLKLLLTASGVEPVELEAIWDEHRDSVLELARQTISRFFNDMLREGLSEEGVTAIRQFMADEQ